MERKLNETETLKRSVVYVRSDEWTLLESGPSREYLLKNIYFRIVNPCSFRYNLDEIPHKKMLGGLIKAFYIFLPSATDSVASMVLNASIMERLELTLDEVSALAEKNTPQIFKPRLYGIGSLLNILTGPSDEFTELDEAINHQMLVLTNTASLFGASTVFYDHLLEQVAEKLQCSFYILPSSLHEVILLKDFGEMNPMCLKAMVKEVNSTEVEPEDILSENVYYYNRRLKTLSVVA